MTARYFYDDDLYRFTEPQPSYWEATAGERNLVAQPLVGDEACDVAVIGGGYTGLSTALHLARDFGVDVRVLEAGHIGWGASGRNAGLCTPGGTKMSLKRQISRYGVDETRRYHQAQAAAVDLVRDIAATESIDLQAHGKARMAVATKPSRLAELAELAAATRDILGLDARVMGPDEFREHVYDSPEHCGALVERPAFGLHPLRYLLGLAEAAERRGAALHPLSEVLDWSKRDGRHVLTTAGGTIRAQSVVVACNGVMPEHLHATLKGRTIPVQSTIIVTRPLSEAELAAQGWRTENLGIEAKTMLTYARLLPDRRLLFGGRGDTVGDQPSAQRIFAGLERRLAEIWPHWKGIDIDYRWRGLVCFTNGLRPAIGRFPDDPSVSFGFGWHASGIASGTWAGRELAGWLAGGNRGGATTPDHLPALVRGLPARYPLAAFRRWYLRAGLALGHLKDALG